MPNAKNATTHTEIKNSWNKRWKPQEKQDIAHSYFWLWSVMALVFVCFFMFAVVAQFVVCFCKRIMFLIIWIACTLLSSSKYKIASL